MAAYLHFGVAAIGILGLGILAYILTGRRSLSGPMLVAYVCAGCGTFLAVRVFDVAELSGWKWVIWATLAAIIGLIAYYLFRSKR